MNKLNKKFYKSFSLSNCRKCMVELLPSIILLYLIKNVTYIIILCEMPKIIGEVFVIKSYLDEI
jgi:hypothetical protein